VYYGNNLSTWERDTLARERGGVGKFELAKLPHEDRCEMKDVFEIHSTMAPACDDLAAS
jgi:hypothetical protein